MAQERELLPCPQCDVPDPILYYDIDYGYWRIACSMPLCGRELWGADLSQLRTQWNGANTMH